MAAEVIIRHCLAGRMPKPGARAGVNDVELADYEATFARRRIVTGTRQTPQPGEPLYRRILGDAYAMLPRPLQVMHDLNSELTATGVASVERGKGLLARLAAAIVGFPPAGDDVPVEVAFRLKDGRELWQRNFAGQRFESTQEEGKGRSARLLCERFGPLNFVMALVVEGERMRLVMRRWTLFGLPLPLALAPRIDAYEHVEDGRFHFHVEISHPLTGLIVRYRGWLVPWRLSGGCGLLPTPRNRGRARTLALPAAARICHYRAARNILRSFPRKREPRGQYYEELGPRLRGDERQLRGGNRMHRILMVIAALAVSLAAASAAEQDIVLRGMGSFHVGGRVVEISGKPVREIVRQPGGPLTKLDPNGQYMVEQMYVQFFLPKERKGKLPLLLWHGGGLTGVTYEFDARRPRRLAQHVRAQGLGHLCVGCGRARPRWLRAAGRVAFGADLPDLSGSL